MVSRTAAYAVLNYTFLTSAGSDGATPAWNHNVREGEPAWEDEPAWEMYR